MNEPEVAQLRPVEPAFATDPTPAQPARQQTPVPDVGDAGGSGVLHTPQPELGRTVDELSLEQALLDVDVANARVLDLTQRLVELSRHNSQLRTELEHLRLEYAQLRSAHERMKGSQAFRLAERLWAIRNALGR